MKQYPLVFPFAKFCRQSNDLVKMMGATDFDTQVAEYCVVRLQDLWNCFCRDIAINSAILNTVTLSGKIYPASALRLKNEKAALAIIQSNPNSSEPKWFYPQVMGKSLHLLGVENRADITSSLFTQDNPIMEIKALRNFVAHRLPNTAKEVNIIALQYGVVNRLGQPSWNTPWDIVFKQSQQFINPSNTLFEAWVDRFVYVARIAIK
jgi:hypothetical protein